MLINNVLIRKLKAPVYNSWLWIVISDNIIKSIDTVEDIVDHRIIEESGKRATKAYTYAYEDHDGRYKIIIFLKDDASPGTIAHEAHHATNIILNWHGVKPSFSNDENESYYLGQIVDKVYDTIKYYKRKVK